MTRPFATYRSLLTTYGKPHWGKLLLLLFLLLGGMGLQIFSPLVLSTFIEQAYEKYPLINLLQDVGLFIMLALGSQVVSVFEGYVASSVAWATTNALRNDLVKHCLQLDMHFHHTHSPGEMIERIDGDIGMLSEFFARFIVAVVANALFLAGIVIVTIIIDWRIGLACCAYMLVTLLLITHVSRMGMAPTKAARAASANLFGFLEERLSGTEEVRALGAETYMLARLHPLLNKRLQTERKAIVVSMLAFRITSLLFAGGTALLLSISTYLFQTKTLNLGTVYLLFSYTQQLVQPLLQISRQLGSFQQAAASISRLHDLLLLQPTVHDGSGTSLAKSALDTLDIRFQNVRFGYNPDEPVLKNVTFALAPGKVLGVLGRTGSGKTTLTRLLFRFYDPQQGSIHIGGVDIRQEHISSVRKHIGLVTQNVELFHASIRDNITMFDPQIKDEDILTAIRTLGLWEWYNALPQGLATWLASGGNSLSAGEAQLLALTRLFLKQPAIIVLDEATAHIDPATEALIEQALNTLLAGCTAVIIAHRLATIQRADNILILEQGEICEYGSRSQLQQDPTSRFAHLLRTDHKEILA